MDKRIAGKTKTALCPAHILATLVGTGEHSAWLTSKIPSVIQQRSRVRQNQ